METFRPKFFGTSIFLLLLVTLAFASNQPDIGHLSFQDRVAYQTRMEQVYWNHTIWPADNFQPKPELRTIISDKQIRFKIEEYLRKSNALDAYFQRPISAQQLQSEMDRVAKETRDPQLLRELWSALGNDPQVIAECFARPLLVDRFTAQVPDFDSSWKNIRKTVSANLQTPAKSYRLPEINSSLALDLGSFDPMAPSSSNIPSAREFHTAVWTGTQMIIWGGESSTTNCFRSGSRYNPSANTWTPTTLTAAPAARVSHTAVWTGSRMLVWGGATCGNVFLRNGGSYNPSNDTWAAITTTGAPSARCCHTAVWTGSQMIVWGGDINSTSDLKSGGRYNPTTNAWVATSTTNAPEAREEHTAVWSGTEMIVWGGIDISPTLKWLNTGGRYNPSTNAWTATSLTNAPQARADHSAVFAGSGGGNAMVVWGGDIQAGNPTFVKTGGRYYPSTDTWLTTNTTGAPAARAFATAVWTGSQAIFWGGGTSSTKFNTGGRYSPASNTWSSMTTTNAPTARISHTAVWTGNVMIIWGGFGATLENTGGRYNPGSNSWTATAH